MTVAEVMAAALAAMAGTVLAIAAPWWVLVALAIAVAVSRRPVALIVLLLVAGGTLAARAEAGLVLPDRGGPVAGRASVLMDPERRPGGWVTELRWEGRRWRAFVSSAIPGVGGLAVGDVVEVAGSTGRLDAPWDWRRARHLAGRLTVRDLRRVDGGAWWWRGANAVRRTVTDGLTSFDPEARALFLGVLVGDDRGQSEAERFRFRSSGLSHLTAVSGQNVAFVLVAVSPVLSRLRLAWRWAVTVALLGWFTLVTRAEPSVVRAVAMAVVAASAAWRGRYVTGVRVVSVAVIACVLADPLLVWSLGFRLSVVASLALVVLARPLARAMPGPRPVAEALAVTAAAQVGTTPLLLGVAGSVPVFGVVANLLAVPVAGLLMVWGVVSAPVGGLVGEPVSSWLAAPSRAIVWWLRVVAGVFADPGLPRWGWGGAVGGALVVGALVWLGRVGVDVPARSGGGRSLGLARRGARIGVAVGSALCLVDAAGLSAGPLAPSARLVDRGVVVRSDAGAVVMVIDSRADEGSVLGMLPWCRCGRLDVVIVTGGGATTSRAVHALREVVDVSVVLAADPTEVRDARRLTEGTLVVGAAEFTVTRSPDGRWSLLEQ